MQQFKKHKLITIGLVLILTLGSYQLTQVFKGRKDNEEMMVYNAQGEVIGSIAEQQPILEGKSYFLDEYSADEQVYVNLYFPQKMQSIIKYLREGIPKENFKEPGGAAIGGSTTGLSMIQLHDLTVPRMSVGRDQKMSDFFKEYTVSIDDIEKNELIITEFLAKELNVNVGDTIFNEELGVDLLIKDVLVSQKKGDSKKYQELYQQFFLDIPLVFISSDLAEDFYQRQELAAQNNGENKNLKVYPYSGENPDNVFEIIYYFENSKKAEDFLQNLNGILEKGVPEGR